MTTSVFFLIAGEPSGDLLGARLMQALKRETAGAVKFVGIGGERMVAEGLEVFFPQAELAHFGLFELLQHIPAILRRINQTVAEVKRLQPTALITIDAPDFCFRVAKKLKDEDIPLIHYVAPTVWAWRPGRARKIAGFLDHLLALLPFEPPYFKREGLNCSFVGHSIIESHVEAGDGAKFRASHNIVASRPIIIALPGSRKSEITRMAPIFGETLRLLKPRHPDLLCVVPTVAQVKNLVMAATKDWPVETLVVQGDGEKYHAFRAATAALACSGTVAIELAMARLPAIIAYRINAVTAFLYRRLIKVRYANLVNIMHDHMVVPEFIQHRCQPEKLAAAMQVLLTDAVARTTQIAELGAVAQWLGAGAIPPSTRAAQAVMQAVRDYPERKTQLRVAQIIPSLDSGGAEQACVDINAALVKVGAHSVVVSSGGRLQHRIEADGGVHIAMPVASKNPLRILINAFQLAALARRQRLTHLHARSRAPAWSALLAARLAGCKFVTTFHALYKFNSPIKHWYNSVMARADAVIAISHLVARHVRSAYVLKRDRLVTISRGIDLAAFDPAIIDDRRKLKLREEWGLKAGERVILLPARLSRIKGHIVLIEAMTILRQDSAHKNIVAIMIGDDQGRSEYRDELNNMIARQGLGDCIRLFDHCADMPAAYALADVVVMASVVPEGFGRVPVEAQAMGVPVIASNLGAVRETVLENETGWLFTPHDARALAHAIDNVLSLPPDKRGQLATTAIAHVHRHFDQRQMTAATLAVYRQLMEQET
jgi:lipid-A-disaccharide synthase